VPVEAWPRRPRSQSLDYGKLFADARERVHRGVQVRPLVQGGKLHPDARLALGTTGYEKPIT